MITDEKRLEYYATRKKNHPNCYKEYHKKYIEKDPEKYRAALKINKKKYQDAHPGRDREYRLRAKYGMTLEEYNKIFDGQGGCCCICGKHQSELRRSFNVDHNHFTGKIRGLLCDACNHGIGNFYDNIDLLRSAILYLENNEE